MKFKIQKYIHLNLQIIINKHIYLVFIFLLYPPYLNQPSLSFFFFCFLLFVLTSALFLLLFSTTADLFLQPTIILLGYLILIGYFVIAVLEVESNPTKVTPPINKNGGSPRKWRSVIEKRKNPKKRVVK